MSGTDSIACIPKQYRTGTAYFRDLKLYVDHDTFIPRPETELLVERAIDTAKSLQCEDNIINILDIGTGSGNIAISLTKSMQNSKIVALDISFKGLHKARENARREGLEEGIRFLQSDLFGGLSSGHNNFDLIVSNPPYISRKDMYDLPPEVKAEPYISLFGGEDGLDFYRRIALEAKMYMKPQGYILFEIGYDQGKKVPDVLTSSGYTDIRVYRDYSGIDRIVKAKYG